MTPADPRKPGDVPREEFEQFLQALIHEIRNQLNGIALEAADLAEQAGPSADSARLRRQVQECSAFLRKVREILAPDDRQIERVPLSDFIQKLRQRKIDAEK